MNEPTARDRELARKVVAHCFPKIEYYPEKVDRDHPLGTFEMKPLEVDFPILPEEIAKALAQARAEGAREERGAILLLIHALCDGKADRASMLSAIALIDEINVRGKGAA